MLSGCACSALVSVLVLGRSPPRPAEHRRPADRSQRPAFVQGLAPGSTATTSRAGDQEPDVHTAHRAVRRRQRREDDLPQAAKRSGNAVLLLSRDRLGAILLAAHAHGIRVVAWYPAATFDSSGRLPCTSTR